MGTRSGKAFLAAAMKTAAALRTAGSGGGRPGRGLPARALLSSLVRRVRFILETEKPSLRPSDREGRPGGLLILPSLPVAILPDLHARPDFLLQAFAWRPPPSPIRAEAGSGQGSRASLAPGPNLAELLGRGEVLLLSLGDLFHSEGAGARERWEAAHREYLSGWKSRSAMDEEMGRALKALCLVLRAKIAFPEHFHILKGNHDNITNEEGSGDHPFYKYAEEGAMVASWFEASYGRELLLSYRELEKNLPLLARGERFAASHAEPAFALDGAELREFRRRPELTEALIWTPNGGAAPGSVEASLASLLGPGAEGSAWFSGHRPVEGLYALRAGGRLIQFHAPGKSRLVFLRPGEDPDPDRVVMDLDP